MTTEEMISLRPEHVSDLRSVYCGLPFDDVEIAARETAPVASCMGTAVTAGFDRLFKNLVVDCVFCGSDRTHVTYLAKNDDGDDALYFMSYAKVGDCEDRIIFKLIIN